MSNQLAPAEETRDLRGNSVDTHRDVTQKKRWQRGTSYGPGRTNPKHPAPLANRKFNCKCSCCLVLNQRPALTWNDDDLDIDDGEADFQADRLEQYRRDMHSPPESDAEEIDKNVGYTNLSDVIARAEVVFEDKKMISGYAILDGEGEERKNSKKGQQPRKKGETEANVVDDFVLVNEA